MDRAIKTKRDQLGDVDQPNNNVTIGVDLGDRKSHICVLDNHGEIVNEEAITTSPAAFKEYFRKLLPAVVAIEVGTHSRWVSQVIHDCGYSAIVAKRRQSEAHLFERR